MGLLADDTLVIMESPVPDAEGTSSRVPAPTESGSTLPEEAEHLDRRITAKAREHKSSVARRGVTKLLFFVNVHPGIQGRRRHGDGDVGVV